MPEKETKLSIFDHFTFSKYVKQKSSMPDHSCLNDTDRSILVQNLQLYFGHSVVHLNSFRCTIVLILDSTKIPVL